LGLSVNENMKKHTLIVLLLLWCGFSSAQLKQFTAEESVLQEAALLPARVTGLSWIPNTDKFAYTKQVDGEWAIMAGEANSTKHEVLVKLSDFNKALDAADLVAKTSFPPFRILSPTQLRFMDGTMLVTYDWVAKKAKVLTNYDEKGANVDISTQNGIAFTVDQNLYLSLPGRPGIAITKEVSADIRNGESAHRNEFGITKGTFFSPQGDQLAFYRVDESMVTKYPLFDLKAHPAAPGIAKYPFAGEKSHHATVGVYNATTGKTVFLKTIGDPEHYLTNITWSPDGKAIYLAELNRDQNYLQLNRYNAATGELEKMLFEERDAKYVEPKHGPQWVDGMPDHFLWESQRDGFNHLYLYKTDGTLLGQLTKSSDWIVTDVLGFDPKGAIVYVETTGNFGADRYVWAYDLKKMTGKAVLNESGTHTATLSPNGNYLIDKFTSVDVPNRTSIIDLKKGNVAQELLNAPNPLKDYAVSKPKLLQIKAADGKTDLTCRMFLPTDFNEKQKYPVIIYVYNGPGVQLVTNTWQAGSALWMEYAAQKGYIVFTVDGRGSANRGLAFEQATFRDLGTVELADQLKGVDYLKSLPYVDGNRLAVHGWSYGGFMTSNMMLRSPGVFRVGVGGGPVIDWSLYEVMYTERYMDTPQTNPEGYKNSLVLNYVKNLKGKLLLIHGTSDDIVVWQNSLNFVERAVTDGIQMDYFVYPNHPHNVRGKDRAHLMRKVLDYIMENDK
jgi:dipeptidyl-peptidase 4